MDHGSAAVAGTRHLFGVSRTLRRLYAPAHEPSEAIDRALKALAIHEQRKAPADAAPLLAPAA